MSLALLWYILATLLIGIAFPLIRQDNVLLTILGGVIALYAGKAYHLGDLSWRNR